MSKTNKCLEERDTKQAENDVPSVLILVTEFLDSQIISLALYLLSLGTLAPP